MTEETLPTELLEEETELVEDRPSVGSLALEVSSRVGAWGLLIGVGCPLVAFVLQGPFPFFLPLTSLGLLAGGIGTLVASTIVHRKLRGEKRLLKVAALLGIPFGVAAASIGAAFLMYPFIPGSYFQVASLALLALGIVLFMVFGAGVLKHVFTPGETDPEPIIL